MSLSTEQQNSESMVTTSHSSSLHLMCHFTAESSSMTVPYRTKLHNDETSCSPTSQSSLTFMSSTSKSLALLVVIQRNIPKWLDQVQDAEMHADGSMRVIALTHKQHAPMPMCAQSVAVMHTQPLNARQSLEEQRWEKCPRYARGLVWTNNEPTHTMLAAYTEIMPTLPTPPANELNNDIALAMIHNYPHLFLLITPIRKLGTLV